MHFFAACYNCKEPGHQWHQCIQPLRPVLQEIKDRVGQDGDRLNVFGDGGNKGAATPQKGKEAINPTKPKK